MSLQKNVAGQKWIVFASDLTTGAAVTGDAANITANLRLDGGAADAVNDLNPTELENGYYVFDLSQAETNADSILITPSSTTANVQVVGSPAAVYTSAPNSNAAVISPTGVVSADATAISGDTIAADNLELMYDGTGYTDLTAPASREQVGLLSSGSSAISVLPSAFVLTTGTVAGGTTIEDAKQLNSVHHRVVDVADQTDLYYEFDIGSDGVPVEFIWDGFAQGGPDEYQMYAYNWAGAMWDQIGEINATTGETAQTYILQATTSHVGSGADTGKVRMRFASTNGAELGTDRLLCSYAVVRRTVGYAKGAIWMDTSANNTNTVSFTDGVADNPVSDMPSVQMLVSQLGLKRVEVSPNSFVYLTTDTDNIQMNLAGSDLYLEGKFIGGSIFQDGVLHGSDSGTASNDYIIINDCLMAGVPPMGLGWHVMSRCALLGEFILSEPGDYGWHDCYSFVAGIATPALRFTPGVINHNVRNYSGGLELFDMTSDHSMSFEGDGQLVIDASCTGGSIAIRGNFELTDNSGGAVTIVDDARVTNSSIEAAMEDFMTVVTIDEPSVGVPPATPTFQEAVMYLYSALRNRIDVDASFKEYHNDLGDVLWKKALTDDSITYRESEGETG